MIYFKNIFIKILFFVILFPFIAFSSGKIVKSKQNVTIKFENYSGDSILRLDNVEYTNSLNQGFTITKLRYYISNIHLIGANGNDFNSNDYSLIDQDEPNSENIILNDVPSGKYSAITFTLGVDSLHNCSGIQSGALDPVNGMFWAWNTGYIFLKMEGKCPQSTSPGNLLEFHIGGYKQPANCIRKVKLNFKENVVISDTIINTLIKIKADALEIFKSPVSIDFSKISSVTDFHNAVMIADNYSDMFSIIEK